MDDERYELGWRYTRISKVMKVLNIFWFDAMNTKAYQFRGSDILVAESMDRLDIFD